MKKVLALLLTLTLTLSMSLCAFAASDKGNNGKGNGANKSDIQTTSTSDTGKSWSNKTENLVKIYNEDGTKVMVPVRALYNHGAKSVVYDPDNDTVTIIGTNDTTVVFKPDSKTATTTASVKLSAITTPLDVTDQALGTIAGTVTANITDPITGTLIPVTLNVTATSSGLIDTAVGLDGPISGTITGTYTNGEQEIAITGTVGNTLLAPEYTLDTKSSSVDFAIPFENQVSNGRAYVPIQDLDKLFGTEWAADTITQPIPTEEPVAPVEETPQPTPEV